MVSLRGGGNQKRARHRARAPGKVQPVEGGTASGGIHFRHEQVCGRNRETETRPVERNAGQPGKI